jgi:phenylpropionate dioxygenase-like ring-hydroxylating dioxygenase large terminal subunit
MAPEDLAGLRLPLDRASHIPGPVYHHPDVLRAEKQAIFLEDWLCVARVEELPAPGDYTTLSILGEAVLITRDAAGALHAFGNVCAHRGVEVAFGSGNALNSSFQCPYHGWLYDLEGRAVGTPFMREVTGFDGKSVRLPPLRLDTWAGWIFICFSERTEPLQAFVAEFEQAFGFLGQEDCLVADKLVFDVDCNWKLVVENLLDTYHASVVHGRTFGGHLKIQRQGLNAGRRLTRRGGSVNLYEAAPHTYSGKPLLGRMPALRDHPESFAASGFMAPNMHFFARAENMRPCVHWPLSEKKTRLVYYNLFHKSFFGMPGFDEAVAEYRRYYTEVLEEDRAVLVSLQNAMESVQSRPGRMAPLEASIHHELNYYADRMFGPARDPAHAAAAAPAGSA